MSRRRRPLGSRVRGLLRSAVAFLFSNVGVTALVLAYTVAGAFMFQAIEGASERELLYNVTRERDRTADYLWQSTLALNMFNETELKLRIGTELWRYQSKVVVAVRRGWDGGRGARSWSFSAGFLYSLTVISTIGYGNLSPRTRLGKLVTICYALLGMPLFLLYLANVGELLARWFKCVYALLCLCRGCPGLARRRVARLRTQIELSEVESIERPEAWKTTYQSDISPYEPHDGYHSQIRPQFDRCRSLRVDHEHRRSNHDFYRREQQQYDRHCPAPRGYYAQTNNNSFRRYESDRTDPRRCGEHFQDLRVYDRREYDERRNFRESEIVRWSDEESTKSSEFTYITFDAQTITVPISVCITVMVSYIIFGSMIFGTWEKWDLLDGSYFCFISLSSIGFGDFVPGERVYSAQLGAPSVVCSLYLMLGMALVAMCFSLMQEQVIHYFAGMKRAFKRMCRCKR